MSWGAFDMVQLYSILSVILGVFALILWHGCAWSIVGGLVCFALAVWCGAKANKAEEEERDPYI